MSDNKEVIDVNEEFPFYEKDPVVPVEEPKEEVEPVVDSDTVAGIKAVTAAGAGPNKLVATGSDGLLPAAIVPVSSGAVVQIVSSISGSVQTTGTTIPSDDTIPQSTEGGEIFTATLTPTSASNYLKVDVFATLANNSTNRVGVFLFRDSGANAIAGGVSCPSGVSNEASVAFSYIVTAGSTSSTTFKVRMGGAAGTTTLNGVASARKYGGALSSGIIVTEISA